DAAAGDVDEKELRRREREKEVKARTKARGRNLALGAELYKRFWQPPAVTREMALCVCLIALEHQMPVAAQGARLTDHALQTEATQKNGAVKVTYHPRTRAAETVLDRVLSARTAEEVIGRTLQVLLAGYAASQDALVKSERGDDRVPGEYGGGPAAGVPRLVVDLVRAAAPDALGAALEKRLSRNLRSDAAAAVAGAPCPGCGEPGAPEDVDDPVAQLCPRCYTEECPWCGEEECRASCTGAFEALGGAE
ncbi:MAG: hypothetical protein AB1416_07130, partial [Actinomycetota bacterium]